jgi:hypothetical protein
MDGEIKQEAMQQMSIDTAGVRVEALIKMEGVGWGAG